MCQDVVVRLAQVFGVVADMQSLFSHILFTILHSAVLVFNNEIESNEKTAAQVYELVYSTVEHFYTHGVDGAGLC